MDVKRALELIESAWDVRVCFGGDSIIDEYRYVTPMNKSPKENLIPVWWGQTEVFRGGVEAAANHARNFCRQVDVCSTGPITRKVRFVEQTYMRKLFEYQVQEGKADLAMRALAHDVLAVTDFGHGEFGKDDRERLCGLPFFLAVNAQTNAANYGYNPITNWRRADYIVIDEPEARLAAHDRESPIEAVVEQLAEGRCQKFIVTRGTEGAVGFDGAQFLRMPAFTKSAVDTMGAGDAFFAVTASMAKVGRLRELLLIGNAAGALKCRIVGHRESITKPALIQFLKEVA